MEDITERKRLLREKYRRIRRGIPSAEKKILDEKIRRRLFDERVYRDCGILLTYVSAPDEADTREIILSALSEGKTVAVPYCVRGARDMIFYVIDSLGQLREGAFSISEPIPELCRPLERFDGAVCLVPALAYDTDGYRLGYGGGYYDRFLSAHKGLYAVGLEYVRCTEAELVRDKYDIPSDMLITEDYVRIIKKQEA